jgi:excisionase family DNA binding protein
MSTQTNARTGAPAGDVQRSPNEKGLFPPPPDTVLAYRINDAAKVAGLSRSSLYVLIGEGKLRSVLIAGRRLIPADALRDLLRGAA